MLRKNGLLAAIKLDQLFGQRRYGHFDHDANSVAGPTKTIIVKDTRTKKKGKQTKTSVKPYKRMIDSKTGRITYKKAN